MSHYDNTPMQYTVLFHCCAIVNFRMKKYDFFLICAQNKYCGYMLVWLLFAQVPVHCFSITFIIYKGM